MRQGATPDLGSKLTIDTEVRALQLATACNPSRSLIPGPDPDPGPSEPPNPGDPGPEQPEPRTPEDPMHDPRIPVRDVPPRGV